MIKIGFTGTRNGTTWAQRGELYMLLEQLQEEGGGDTWFHHGDCVGADDEAHTMAFDLGFIIVVHPPVDSKLRAWCGTKRGKDDGKYRPANQHTEPRPYIERNHDIVDACDVLVAIPGTEEQGLRSGTWATMRYAHKQGKRIEAVLPSGKRWTPDPLTERLS